MQYRIDGLENDKIFEKYMDKDAEINEDDIQSNDEAAEFVPDQEASDTSSDPENSDDAEKQMFGKKKKDSRKRPLVQDKRKTRQVIQKPVSKPKVTKL